MTWEGLAYTLAPLAAHSRYPYLLGVLAIIQFGFEGFAKMSRVTTGCDQHTLHSLHLTTSVVDVNWSLCMDVSRAPPHHHSWLLDRHWK